MAEPRFDIPAIGLTGGVLADVLRLEVETDPAGLRNLIANPDGRLGGWGWVSPIAGTVVRSSSAGTQALEFVTSTTSVTTNFTSEYLPVTAGDYIAARWTEKAFTDLAGTAQTTGYYRVRFEFVDASGAALTSSAQSAYFQITTAGTVRQYSAVLVPASATRARLRIDAYSNASASNPTANRVYSVTAVTVATAATTAALQTTRTNLVTNPSFETNTTGWSWDPAEISSFIRSSSSPYVGTYHGRAVKPSTSPGANILGPSFAVTPGQSYTASAYLLFGVGAPKVRIEWLGVGGVHLSYSAASESGTPSVYSRRSVTVVAPAGAVTGRLNIVVYAPNIPATVDIDGAMVTVGPDLYDYFDGSTTDAGGWLYDWTGTAHASTSNAVYSDLSFIEPVPTVDILGPTHKIAVSREALAVGTLTAEILDSTLDPADAPLIRPGRAVRLSARRSNGEWSVIFTGVLDRASVVYHLLEDRVPESKRARIAMTAVDNIATLAGATRTESVATIAELPYVLEGASVPWNVNGSGNQIATATVRANADNVTALDQVALTRDTARGYAWVDRLGILQAWDAASLSATPALTMDESIYSEASIGFNTDELINEVAVTVRSKDATGQTIETASTYLDGDSIATWGRKRAEFTVLAPADAATFAAAVLAANATPTVRINEVMTSVRNAALLDVAHLDLYDAITLANADKGINQLARVASIKMDIDNGSFFIDHGFGDPDSVASPQVIPPLTSTATPPPLYLTQNVSVSAAVTGTAVINFPAGYFATAPRVFLQAFTSSVWMAYVANTPTTTTVTIGVRQIQGTSTTATIPVFVQAIPQ